MAPLKFIPPHWPHVAVQAPSGVEGGGDGDRAGGGEGSGESSSSGEGSGGGGEDEGLGSAYGGGENGGGDAARGGGLGPDGCVPASVARSGASEARSPETDSVAMATHEPE